MDRAAEWVVFALMLAAATAVTLWMAGAIYYDVCGGARWGRWVALAWVVGVIAMFAAWQPLWQPIVALLGVPALFLAWWYRQKPSNDRDWDPSVAVLPRAVRAGDAVTIENVRNFEYRSLDDFTPRYETRTYHLSNLKGVDVIFFNWGIALDEPPRPGLRLRARRPHLHVDRGAVPQGAEVLDPSQPVSTAGADLRRRGRTRRHPAPHEVQPDRRRRTCTASTRRSRNCGPCSSITSRRSTACTRRRAGTTSCSRIARRPSTSFPAAGSAATGASSPTPGWTGPSTRTVDWTGLCPSRNSADSPISTTLRTRPRGRVRGPHPPRTRKAPP